MNKLDWALWSARNANRDEEGFNAEIGKALELIAGGIKTGFEQRERLLEELSSRGTG